jgi:Flp pilus assembly protein TadD
VERGDGSNAGLAQAERSMALLAAGDVEGALAEARLGVAADPHCAAVHVATARALQRLGRAQECLEELRRAAQLDARAPEIQRELGYAAARAGDLAEATASWKRYLHLAPAGPERDEVVESLDAASRLRAALEAHAAV